MFILQSLSGSFQENTDPGNTVYGAPVAEATDPDGDDLTYSLHGADADAFNINPSNGALSTKSGVTYDYEAKSVYSVTLQVDDGKGGTATKSGTISLRDVDEPPLAPAAPTVSAVSGTTDSLEVSWTAPDNSGRPDIESYDLRYRKANTVNWTDGPQDETGLTATISGLDAASEYQVEVQATNHEGDGVWSSAGSGTTNASLAPTVSSVVVTSTPGADETYAIGDMIRVTVTFDQDVTVTGAPRIQLRIGGGDPEHLKWADYTGPATTEALVFAYTVQAGDMDGNGIYIAADELFLNGGTIQSADGTDANLDYTQPGTQSGHKVDTGRPTPRRAWTSLDGASIIILFSEPLAATTAPASAFTLAVDTGTAPVVSSATASGYWVTLGLDSALTADQVVSVMYVDATSSNDSAAVQDAVGNDAADFTQTIENTVPQPVPSNWGLLPSGLGAGDHFRLVFLSSTTRDGQSTNIADYNTFVQTAAASGHADIQQYRSTFRVVGSTADTDARDNTNTRYTGDGTAATDDDSDLGVPIYWLGGNKVADDYRDFYDETWDDEANAKDESGGNRITSGGHRPFTGSDHDGSEAFDLSNASRALGADFVQLGLPNDASGGPLSFGGADSKTDSHPFYGLSPVFRVEGQTTTTNAAPEFSADTDLRTVPENSPTGTSVGDPVTATDDDGDTLTYTLEGTDAASFDIDSSTGQIQTKSGVTYDHEAKSSYSVIVKADDSNGGTDTIAVTINVADVDEPPSAPAAPTVTPVTGSSDSLDVSWTAPDNTGKPDIESYDLQYRIGTSAWTDGPQGETGLSATITGLAAGTEYQVRVRATNDEGDSLFWSALGTATTDAQAEAPSVLTVNRGSADGTYAINATLSVLVTFSAAVTASGTPQLALDIGGETRQAEYASGTGTQSLLFSYTVAEGDEDTDGIRIPSDSLALNGGAITAGGAAATLTHGNITLSGMLVDGVRPTLVSAETSVDGNTVSLTFSESLSSADASSFVIPPIGLTVVSSATIDDDDDKVVTLRLSTAISHGETRTLEISPGTVQDAAGNYNSSLSKAITNNVPPPNAAPVFTSADNFSADENTTAVGTVIATDADAGDTVTYAVTGGDDQARFQIGSSTGLLTFATAPDHENPADAGTNNDYQVTVTATGGTGARALTTEQDITVTVTDVDETPAVASVVVTSTPTAAADTYGLDETIEVTVTFDQAVTVTGTPRIQLRIGGGAQDNLKWANYASGSGNEALVFAYTVQAGDMDDNGIYIEANELELNSGTIQGVDDNVAATLTYTRPGTQSGHKVDGSLSTTNTAPTFGQESTTREFSENSAVGTNVGAAVTATDDDGDTLTYSLEGTDDASFDIDASTGQIRTRSGVTYDHETKPSYAVTVKADDGRGGTDSVAVAIDVLAVDAPPTGDFVSVCDRSPSMKFSLVYEVFGITLTTDLDEACKRVTRHHLANIYSLTVWGPSSLSTRDLDGLTGLRLMSLSRGSLDSLPKGVFGGLGKLEKLNILYTDLDELDPAIFGERADDLKSLALWGNDITSLPAGVFDGLTALENLSIIEQGIQALPADLLDDNTKLKKLTMRIGSGWTQMESGFLSDLGDLRELHLGGNGLTSLPDGVFDNNRKLKKVYLYDNALASLPDGVFSNNTALEKVYLADNALTSLPDGIFDNTAKLKTVDLRNNNLETLPGDLFPHGEPDKLYLSGNPGHPFTFD